MQKPVLGLFLINIEPLLLWGNNDVQKKVVVLTRQIYLKRLQFATIGIFYIKDLGFNEVSAMAAIKYQWLYNHITVLLF